jgi:hypothetical protein
VGYEHIVDLNTQYKLSLKRIADFVEFMKTSLDEVQNQEKAASLEIIEGGIELILTRTVAGKTHAVMHLTGREEAAEVVKA